MHIAALPSTTSDATTGAEPVEDNIDLDLVRGRRFDFDQRFMPEGLSRVGRLEFLRRDEQRLLSQIQARTYASMLGLLKRLIGARMAQITRDQLSGDHFTLESLARFSDKASRHQALCRRIGRMIAVGMAVGYDFVPEPIPVHRAVTAASNWAVLALNLQIDLLARVHCLKGLEPDGELSELSRDMFLFRWKLESRNVIPDEVEWERENMRLTPAQRDQALNDFIGLMTAVDAVLQAQAGADASYFLRICGRALTGAQTKRLASELLGAYRWQYIASGAQDVHFRDVLHLMLTTEQEQRVDAALGPLTD